MLITGAAIAACNDEPPPPVKEDPDAAFAAPSDVAAAPSDAQRTASGLASKVLQAGTGADKPRAWDSVQVNYTGWTTDGKMFDSSVMRGEPTTFGLERVIKGWTEGVQLMVEGEKTRFWIPSALAYGDTPKRPGAPAGPLVFDIELLSVQ
jgi:peptidylprolyl isomerase